MKPKTHNAFVYAPLYDPRRDGGPVYASPQAEMLGDPPIGRRQMLERHEPIAGFEVPGDDEW